MKGSGISADHLVSRADEDIEFRERLIAEPREAVEGEFGVKLERDHVIHVHEDTYSETHVVLRPRSKLSKAERNEARTGAASLEFLRRTLSDPAPPMRPPSAKQAGRQRAAATAEELVARARESIRRGLTFLETTISENGAWHCIRFNVADPNIPRHFERPPFVSALCVLALECCREERARAMCAATRGCLIDTIEHPGFWRYYLHLPLDLDSTALCSLVLGNHPWVLLRKNMAKMLGNRDREGRFMTWVLEDGEPDVVAPFRIEADPVVNANVIAYLGDIPETRDARKWLVNMVVGGKLQGSSKWYPDTVSIFYAIARAMDRARPALDQLRPELADRILALRNGSRGFGNVLQAAQAISALDRAGGLERIDAATELEGILVQQRDDGSWPELLAFGDQSLKWGAVGQIGHGSEAVTSAFCIEAIERLTGSLTA